MAKRRGNNEASITERKNRDGKVTGYQVRVSLPNGARRTLGTVVTKAEARRLAQHGQVEIDAGRFSESPRQTVEAYLNAWLETKRREREYKTYVTYRTAVEHALPIIGHVRLDALRSSHVQQLLDDLNGRKGARTVQLVHTVLHNALTRAVKLDLIGRNPTDAVDPPRPARRERPWLNLNQARALFDATHGEWLHALYVTVATTGLRQGEAFGLAWEDIHLENRYLVVQRSLQRQTGRGFVLKDVKTEKSRRVVPLTSVAVEAVRAHRKMQLERRILLGSDWMDSGRVFTAESGAPLDAANTLKRYYAALEAAGLPRVTFHDLRHTADTMMANEGVPAHVIQAVLGHASIRTTMDIYTHVASADLDIVRDKLNSAFARPAGHVVTAEVS
jgi:integrase